MRCENREGARAAGQGPMQSVTWVRRNTFCPSCSQPLLQPSQAVGRCGLHANLPPQNLPLRRQLCSHGQHRIEQALGAAHWLVLAHRACCTRCCAALHHYKGETISRAAPPGLAHSTTSKKARRGLTIPWSCSRSAAQPTTALLHTQALQLAAAALQRHTARC